MRYKMTFCLVVLFVCLAGCKTGQITTQSGETEGWNVYCVNNSETRVVSETYEMTETDPEKQIEYLIRCMSGETKELTNQKAISDMVTLKDWSLEGGLLTLNFESDYAGLFGVSEILRRTAVVKTLCQVESVDYVSFTVQGQPLMDSNAQPIGVMSSEDFIDNTGGETNYMQQVTLNLYFAGEDGQTLKQSRIHVEFDGTISIEELVIRQLIAGPLEEEAGLRATIPANTQLLKVSRKDGICYVDFDGTFLEKVPDVSDAATVFSVVNSLTEISGINRVQFMINGELKKTYRESMEFDGLFERNLDIVETEG